MSQPLSLKLKINPTQVIYRAPLFVVALCKLNDLFLYGMHVPSTYTIQKVRLVDPSLIPKRCDQLIIAKYLQTTQHWSIKYKRPKPRLDLKPGTIESISPDSHVPLYPQETKQGKLICFADVDYGNYPTKRRSRYAFTYSDSAIVYRSKAQSIVALKAQLRQSLLL